MAQSNADVLQGTLDMLILKTLLPEPMHGLGGQPADPGHIEGHLAGESRVTVSGPSPT
jgi:hypothetical protein